MEQEIKEETNQSNKLYRIEEMIDAIDKSISNAEQVKDDQLYLIAALENLNDPRFTDLIKSMKEQIENLDNQIKTLGSRKVQLSYVVESCKESKEIETIINKFIDGLGMFDK